MITMTDITANKLGKTDLLIELDQRDDFMNLILSMSQQAKHRILIFSHDLDKSLYGTNELYEAIKKLAIQSQRTHIQILVQDAILMTKNGHPLLKLSHRISSHVSIKITSKEYRDIYETFIVFDDCGYIIQGDPERYEARGNFSAPAETKHLVKKFHEMWERGVIDNSLRQLGL